MRAPLFFAALLVCSGILHADGGQVILRAGRDRFQVTLFASPAPLSVGITDLSVLIQRADTAEPVLDAAVKITFVKDAQRLEFSPTRNAANNKLLYAASASIPEEGNWNVTVAFSTHNQTTIITGLVPVAPPPQGPPKFVIPLLIPGLALLLFAIHQKLSKGSLKPEVGDRLLQS